MKKVYILFLIISISSCQISKSPLSSDQNSITSLGLLDRLRSMPGLKISGFNERNAEVYLRGQTSIMYYQEVVFYINSARVGNYSSAYQLVQPENIKSIRLLKSASELSIYGSDGRDGVILITTKN